MKNKLATAAVTLVIFIAALLVAGQIRPAAAGDPPQITASKTAFGFWERRVDYDWTIQKVALNSPLTVGPGQTALAQFRMDAYKTVASQTDVTGVRGEICVQNNSTEHYTENLTIVDRVWYRTDPNGEFAPVPGAILTITPANQIPPRTNTCYPYEITFTPIPGAAYRNAAGVTITNNTGKPSEDPEGPTTRLAFFDLPPAPVVIATDDAAAVTDTPLCPAGFTCAPSAAGPLQFTGTGSVFVDISVTNASAACAEHFTLTNTATITASTSGQQSSASANADLYTGPCPGGCTLTIGYWKTHAGFTGNNPDHVTALLPIWLGTPGGAKSVQVTGAAQAVSLLQMSGDASNGINKLYAQLLAAKLNIVNGADGSAVASTIAAADGFLATNNAANWSALSKAQKQQVLAWMTTLDSYNNGLIGPAHCP